MRPTAVACVLGFVLVGAGCVKTTIVSQAVAAMDRTRLGPDVNAAKELAPQEFAHAEEERRLAAAAQAHGAAMAADLYAERAVVAYERAVVLARLARATTAGDAAQSSLDRERAEAQALAAARVQFEKEADALAAELGAVQQAAAFVHVGPADPAREEARRIATRSLLAEARLLCGAAHLVTPSKSGNSGNEGSKETPVDAVGLEAAERDASTLESSHWTEPAPKGRAPIETAARVRAACLEALTRTRRVNGSASAGDSDALLSVLSARGGWDPSRDERGVVVTLRGAFKGTSLAPEAKKTLSELGQVAATHPAFSLQVVLHDAAPPTEAERTEDKARAQTALAFLRTAGASVAPSAAETMDARLPVTDPADAMNRGRNARLEVVFVSRNE